MIAMPHGHMPTGRTVLMSCRIGRPHHTCFLRNSANAPCVNAHCRSPAGSFCADRISRCLNGKLARIVPLDLGCGSPTAARGRASRPEFPQVAPSADAQSFRAWHAQGSESGSMALTKDLFSLRPEGTEDRRQGSPRTAPSVRFRPLVQAAAAFTVSASFLSVKGLGRKTKSSSGPRFLRNASSA